jgi:hypothetical protein
MHVCCGTGDIGVLLAAEAASSSCLASRMWVCNWLLYTQPVEWVEPLCYVTDVVTGRLAVSHTVTLWCGSCGPAHIT